MPGLFPFVIVYRDDGPSTENLSLKSETREVEYVACDSDETPLDEEVPLKCFDIVDWSDGRAMNAMKWTRCGRR